MSTHSQPSVLFLLLLCPVKASRSVPGSTPLHVITPAADNRHFIRKKACQCRACRLPTMTVCQMPTGVLRLRVADLYAARLGGLHGCSPLSLQDYYFVVLSLTDLTCLFEKWNSRNPSVCLDTITHWLTN